MTSLTSTLVLVRAKDISYSELLVLVRTRAYCTYKTDGVPGMLVSAVFVLG